MIVAIIPFYRDPMPLIISCALTLHGDALKGLSIAALPSTVTCPALAAPENGEIELTTTTVGSVATFTCLEGFRLEGSAERTCQGNSQWTGGDTTCEGKFLQEIPYNGIVSGDSIVANGWFLRFS